jgi:hypothetical protein
MQFKYIVKEQLHYGLGSEWVTRGDKAGVLCEFVHNYEYSVLPFRFRKALGEVHGQVLEGHIRNW